MNEYEKHQEEIKMKYQKLLGDQKRLKVLYRLIAAALFALFVLTLWKHIWFLLPLQVIIGGALWFSDREGKRNQAFLEGKVSEGKHDER